MNVFDDVTILVLVEYSLQCNMEGNLDGYYKCHNPCFSRILFAMICGKPKKQSHH